jgi:hypothetical protein
MSKSSIKFSTEGIPKSVVSDLKMSGFFDLNILQEFIRIKVGLKIYLICYFLFFSKNIFVSNF